MVDLNKFTPSTRLTLPSGTTIPLLHLGVYQLSGAACTAAVRHALKHGYRAIDSAQWYGNEAAVASAVHGSGLPRADVFFTTKLRDNASYDATRAAVRESLRKTRLDYIDLYLLHSPLGGRQRRSECWRALVDARADGEVRAIGVSNFGVAHLRALAEDSSAPPEVNQIEVHPWNANREIVEYCQERGIVVQAYAPPAAGMRMGDRTAKEIAQRHGKTVAQVLVRWGLQKGFVVLPKSRSEHRIKENADVGDFELSEEDVIKLDGLHEGLVTDWDVTDAP